MIALILYTLSLLIPGYFLKQLIFPKQSQTLLFSVALSLCLQTILIATGLLLQLDIKYFYISMVSISLFLIIFKLIKFKSIRFRFDIYHSLAFAIIILCCIFYHMYFGFYFEIPADIYKHIEFYQDANTHLANHHFHDQSIKGIFSKSALIWYYIAILYSKIINENIVGLLSGFMLINISFFLLCIYQFSARIFEAHLSRLNLFLCCLLATAFVALHLGISIFSFIRYYAMAPVILTISLYIATVILLLDYLKNQLKFSQLIFASLFFVYAVLLHRQEAMFMLTAYLIIPPVIVLGKHYRLNPKLYNRSRAMLISALVIIPFSCLFLYIYLNFESNPAEYPKLISLVKIWPGGKDFFVLNPLFQFYTVLTHWGIWIYLVYFIFYKHFKGNPYIQAMMLMPLVTIFNPLFVDFFLKVTKSIVLWRFLYIIPIHFVAAFIIIQLFGELKNVYQENYYISRFKKIAKAFLHVVSVIPIALFLYPVSYNNLPYIGNINLPYSRINSLEEISPRNSYQHWQDVLDFLNDYPEQKNIVTDAVTGYLITAMTKHYNSRYKFLAHTQSTPYLFEDYTNNPLKAYNNQLLIINLREGRISENGQISGHWPADILNTDQYYNDSFIQHVKNETRNFIEIFNSNDVFIYEIKYE